MATIEAIHPPALGEASAPSLEGDALRLTDAMSDLIRVVQFRDRDRACCYDVSVTQCYALKAIVDGDALTVNELSAHLYLDKSTASRVANALVKRGLLVRQRDPSDGRVVLLGATTEGRRVAARIVDDLVNEYAELLEEFDPATRSAVSEVIRRIAKSLASGVSAEGGSCCVVR